MVAGVFAIAEVADCSCGPPAARTAPNARPPRPPVPATGERRWAWAALAVLAQVQGIPDHLHENPARYADTDGGRAGRRFPRAVHYETSTP